MAAREGPWSLVRATLCQASMTRMCAWLEIRTGRLAHTRMYVASRKGARSASEMQFCWLDRATLEPGLKLNKKLIEIENGLEFQKFSVGCPFWGGCYHPYMMEWIPFNCFRIILRSQAGSSTPISANTRKVDYGPLPLQPFSVDSVE